MSLPSPINPFPVTTAENTGSSHMEGVKRFHYLFQQPKEHISVYSPLMGLIQHDDGILG